MSDVIEERLISNSAAEVFIISSKFQTDCVERKREEKILAAEEFER